VLSAVIFPVTTYPNLSFGGLLFWLCASSAAIYGFGPSYWVLPTLTLGESAAAAAVGLINSCGGLGGFVGPTVVGALLTATTDFRAAAYAPPTLLLMGNEQAGLPSELADTCDVTVKIPMRGRADSLNLAVATGIMIYAVTG